MFDLLDRSAVSYQIVLTKHDELKASERVARAPSHATAALGANGRPPSRNSSSPRPTPGEGIAELRAAAARLLAERNA